MCVDVLVSTCTFVVWVIRSRIRAELWLRQHRLAVVGLCTHKQCAHKMTDCVLENVATWEACRGMVCALICEWWSCVSGDKIWFPTIEHGLPMDC